MTVPSPDVAQRSAPQRAERRAGQFNRLYAVTSPAVDESPPKQIIDVERLVKELQQRVARERAAGGYVDDLSAVQLDVLPPAGANASLVEGFDLAAPGPRIRFRPELGFSAKPVIGPVITLVKKFILRLLFYVLDDLAQQADAAVRRLETALAAEAAARTGEAAALEARSTGVDERVTAEVAAREGVQRDVRSLAERLAESRDRLERLQLESRLARLERARRTVATTAPQEVAAAPPPPVGATLSFDYETFEARFRPEESVRGRQKTYVELLDGRSRVVDLGCGRGELVALLNESGVPAYGVEIDPDFVELLREKGIEVVTEDAVAHLAGLEAGAVDGIVGSHLIEHLLATSVARLVSLAAEKLADGGILILETPNPESVVAGSVNFHRDLTHVRPIHPDTLAFLCESAGFSDVEVRRLSPVPEDQRLPAPVSDDRLTEIVQRLNELLYGYQDYTVIARKRS
jgi:SAM-dependent methyltransferase